MSIKIIISLFFGFIIVATLFLLSGYWFGDEFIEPVDLPLDRVVTTGESNDIAEQMDAEVEIIARDLEIPWEIVFLKDGDLLVTQRTGSVKRIGLNGRSYNIEGVVHRGEGGLLGMVLHPDFESNRYIYLYMTTESSGGLENRVVRYLLADDRLEEEEVILDGIPGAIYHDGGRLAFGPDGYLYVATGDARDPNLAQDTGSLAGKILRLHDNGVVPADNPFGNEVYSYGHRNPQGLTWDDEGRLWSTEHGPTARDELNLIEMGRNYGWPVISGDEERNVMETPVLHSGTDTWAPAGAVYWQNGIFFGGLRGSALYRASLQDTEVIDLKKYFEGEFGRIRAVAVGPDNYIYITTSNTDGRGRRLEGDDKIIRIHPRFFH